MLGNVSRQMRRERNGDHEANISEKEGRCFRFILERANIMTLCDLGSAKAT